MKTTLELPDDLMRRIKIRAAQTDQTLRDTITALILRGFAAGSAPTGELPAPVRLASGLLAAQELEAATQWGRD